MKAETEQPSSHLSKEKFVVSSCLAGVPCRYDGSARTNSEVCSLVRSGQAHALCPECLAGLETPRSPSEIVGGDGYDVLDGRARIICRDGKDLSADFIRGARKFLAYVQMHDIETVILKKKSPSCGVGHVYDGTFSGNLRSGPGVTAALLLRNGIRVREE